MPRHLRQKQHVILVCILKSDQTYNFKITDSYIDSKFFQLHDIVVDLVANHETIVQLAMNAKSLSCLFFSLFIS